MTRCRSRNALLAALLGLAAAFPAAAQLENPAYVDNSPRAWELIQRAREQAADNEGEAVRIYQELLDDYGQKLIPAHAAADDHLVSVRQRVVADLLKNPELLDRYQLVQGAEAQRLLDAGELRLLSLSRSLTSPGLEGLLRLAQSAIESAQFHTGLAWLREAAPHPDLEGRRFVHCWYMIGLAAHYLSDAAQRQQAIEVLQDIGSSEAEVVLEQLRQLAAHAGPEVPQGMTPLDRTDADDLDELVGQTIWSVPLGDSLHNRRFDESRPEPSLQRLSRFNTIAPTVSGAIVYINEGQTIRALDRFTGRDLWSWTGTGQPAEDPGSDDSGDLSVIALQGDTLVALTGHAYASRRSDTGKVVCLDSSSGRLRWSTLLDRIAGDEEYAGLFPHGAPIIADGHVFVLARLVTKQQLTGCYMVALDVTDGSLVWIRHLASSGSRTSNLTRSFSTPLYRDGSLFIASPVGAIACIDAATGVIRWLRREHVPVTVRGRQTSPWEMSGAVLAGDRVIALSPDQRRVLVLDRETGDELQVHDGSQRDRWNAPAYLLADDRHIFAVGSEIRGFSLEALDWPVWRFPPPPQSRVDGQAAELSTESVSIVGRVQLADEGLIVPTTQGIMVVDRETGAIQHHLAIDTAGNPLAVDSQLLVATADSLDVYMSLQRAEQMLRQRIAAAPHDAEPALSLLLLGMQAQRLELAMEAAQLSLQAIDRNPDAQQASETRRELMSLLLELHRRGLDATDEAARSLFAMIDSVAATADQRVGYMLAYGDWLAQPAPGQAVETYQTILYDSTLRRTPVVEASVLQPAGRLAAARIANLLNVHGERIYAPQADYAGRALEHLVAVSPPTPERLAAHALEFPFADAGLDAARRAAQMQHDSGRTREALAILFAAYDLAPTRHRATALLGAFIEIAANAGHETLAIGVLESLTEEFGDIALETAGGVRRAGDWLASIEPPFDERLPGIGTLGKEGDLLEGVLVPPVAGFERPSRPDRALLIQGDSLRAVGMPERETLWGPTPVEDPGAQLLSFREDELLLLMNALGEDPQVVSLDPHNGQRRWTSPRLSDHLQEPLARSRGVLGQMPNGMPLDPKETLAVLQPDTFYLVRRVGGVAAFDRATGAMLWALDQTLPEIHQAIPHSLGLLLVGVDYSADAAQGSAEPTPWVVLLDAGGEVIQRIQPRGQSGILWSQIDAFGGLLCASGDGVESLDLLQGRSRWMNFSPEALETRNGWVRHLYAVVEDQASALRSVRWSDGAFSPPFQMEVEGDWDQHDLKEVHVDEGSVLARFVDRLIRFDHRGNVIGADVVKDRRNYRTMLRASDGLVILSLRESRHVQREQGRGRVRQWTYQVYVLSPNGKVLDLLELPPLNRRIDDAVLLEGWLLLSTMSETIAFPIEREPAGKEQASAG